MRGELTKGGGGAAPACLPRVARPGRGAAGVMTLKQEPWFFGGGEAGGERSCPPPLQRGGLLWSPPHPRCPPLRAALAAPPPSFAKPVCPPPGMRCPPSWMETGADPSPRGSLTPPSSSGGPLSPPSSLSKLREIHRRQTDILGRKGNKPTFLTWVPGVGSLGEAPRPAQWLSLPLPPRPGWRVLLGGGGLSRLSPS